MITSEITHLMYVPEHMVRIVNTRQAMLYIKHQCTLYDLYESDGTLVFLFDRKESKPFFEKWIAHELV